MSELNSKIVERIKKLLALAANNPNEHEAQVAAAKAQEMLEAHNLDMAQLGHTAQGRPRADQKQKGGLYGWQRSLWKAVAELNFCHYWSIKGLAAGSTYEHRILGSSVNVLSTQLMAEYLQGAIERLAQQWAKEQGMKSVFVRQAIAYREGMAARIVERLQIERRRKLAEERAREAERKAAASHPGAAPTTTALTLVDVQQTEADLNNDYLNGWEEGTTAANRAADKARQAAWAAKYQEEQRLHEERLANDPAYAAEHAAKKKAEEEYWTKKEAEWAKKDEAKARRQAKNPPKPRYRKLTPEEERMNLAGYWEGRDKGDAISLNEQINKEEREAIR